LEKDMDLISMRDLTKEEVVKISRDLLRQAYGSLEQNKEQISAKIYEGITDDRILGDCPKCGTHKLRVIRSKATKKRFVGCEGYPECDQTYPLPQRGDIIGTDEVCPECGSPKIKILGGRRPWVLCLDPYCPTKEEYRQKQAARAAHVAGGKTTGRRPAAGTDEKASATGGATKKARAAASETGAASPRASAQGASAVASADAITAADLTVDDAGEAADQTLAATTSAAPSDGEA
jgi:DNA topoisomerase-1